jgi:hypothetical protein
MIFKFLACLVLEKNEVFACFFENTSEKLLKAQAAIRKPEQAL